MVTNHAAHGRASHRVMTRHVTNNAAHRRAFDAAVSATSDGQRNERNRNSNRQQVFAQF
jgi:hypothetical protein